MKRKYFFFKNDDGFTLIEVLVALTLLSAFGFILLRGYFDTHSSLTAINGLFKMNSLSLRIDDILRTELLQVRQPYWYPELIYKTTENSVTFPYYCGDPNEELSFSWEDDCFYIKNKKHTLQFTNIQHIEYQIISGPTENSQIFITIAYINGKKTEHSIRFGSSSL